MGMLVDGTWRPSGWDKTVDASGAFVRRPMSYRRAIGDEALLLGEQEGDALDAHDLAVAARTIPYEVLTNVSRRVPRIYLNE